MKPEKCVCSQYTLDSGCDNFLAKWDRTGGNFATSNEV